MTDPLINLFTLPILPDALVAGVVTGAVFWFFYKPPNIVKTAYDSIITSIIPFPAIISGVDKPLKDLKTSDPQVYTAVTNITSATYKTFDKIGLVPSKYSGLLK